jgi:hypothetical protein
MRTRHVSRSRFLVRRSRSTGSGTRNRSVAPPSRVISKPLALQDGPLSRARMFRRIIRGSVRGECGSLGTATRSPNVTCGIPVRADDARDHSPAPPPDCALGPPHPDPLPPRALLRAVDGAGGEGELRLWRASHPRSPSFAPLRASLGAAGTARTIGGGGPRRVPVRDRSTSARAIRFASSGRPPWSESARRSTSSS